MPPKSKKSTKKSEAQECEKGADEIGKYFEKMGKEFGESFGKSFGKALGSIIAIVVNLAILYVINNISRFGFSFITDDFSDWVPVANIAISVSIVAHVIMLFVHIDLVRELAQLISDAFSGVSAFYLFRIYPFDFDKVGLGWMNWAGKLMLIGAMIGVAIGVIVRFVKIVMGSYHEGKSDKCEGSD